jgi:signal recognition particle subunit SRP19
MLANVGFMPDKDKLVVWPIYFDSKRSRRDGRAVAAEHAISSPIIDDVIDAAMKAGLKPEIEREKRHPKIWHESAGRILVQKNGPKSSVLKRIAGHLKAKKKKG